MKRECGMRVKVSARGKSAKQRWKVRGPEHGDYFANEPVTKECSKNNFRVKENILFVMFTK